MAVMLSGRAISVSAVQFLNASLSIEVMVAGRLIFSFLQPLKAAVPMVVTDSGKVMVSNALQLRKK